MLVPWSTITWADRRQAIALQMLQALAFRWESPPNFALVVLAIIWLIILLLVAVPNVVEHNIYGPTGYCKPQWTWLGSKFDTIA